jgi:hypothetical protein
MAIRTRKRLAGIGLCALAGLALAVGLWQWRHAASGSGETSPPADKGGAGERTGLHPGGPERPDIEITPDHQLARVRHKDSRGLSPYETVETPEGTVTIRRTFSQNGKLLEETAERDGKPVPVPAPGLK